MNIIEFVQYTLTIILSFWWGNPVIQSIQVTAVDLLYWMSSKEV